MADKAIGSLPEVTSLQNDSLLPVEQGGAACRISGRTLLQYIQGAADVTRAEEAAERAETAAGEAEAAAVHEPAIGANGNWYTWNQTAGAYVDTGVAATGPQGPKGPAGSGTGDMLSSQYDPAGTVQTSGGIPAYVSAAITGAIEGSY